MDADEALVRVLENARAQPLTRDTARLVQDAMERHHEFSQTYVKCYIGDTLTLQPITQCGNLLYVAIQRGARNAVQWYRQIICSPKADVQVWCKIAGIIIENTHAMSNGVTLVALDDLPDIRRFESINEEFYIRNRIFEAFGYANFELGSHEFSDEPVGRDIFLSAKEILKETIEAFCLDGRSCPTVVESWIDFVDRDFDDAKVGFQFSMNDTEGPPPRGYGKKVEEGIPWVESYLKLPEETRSYLRLPISRLNMAMRDFTPKNKAIDGSICLDALIGSNKNDHIDHELGMKSALILGATAQEREQIYYDVKEFYSLRNEAVHPGKDKNITNPEGTASRGLEICLRLLRTMIIRGEKLEWGSDFAEKGGPLWNRFRWVIPSRESKRPKASMGG